MKTFLVLLALAAQAAAADPLGPPAKDIEGVYKHRFMNGVITPGEQPGEKDTFYQAEDILEIVRHDEEHIYFRVRLNYYNGHMCSLYGMARYEGGSFVFREREQDSDGGDRCTLTITPSKEAVMLNDRVSPASGASCRSHCGIRGSLSNISMPNKLRRPILYKDRILNSQEYKHAAEQLGTRQPEPAGK